jgi:hypothetical protein
MVGHGRHTAAELPDGLYYISTAANCIDISIFTKTFCERNIGWFNERMIKQL